jgi:hypothetical protein
LWVIEELGFVVVLAVGPLLGSLLVPRTRRAILLLLLLRLLLLATKLGGLLMVSRVGRVI